MNEQRLYSIILGPITTEKSVRAASHSNQVVFRVAKNATKRELVVAVEKLFSVNVVSVRTVNVKGKEKTFKQTLGRRSDWKKAYVRLAEGQDLNIANFE
jgi:large subunit ribosomal protein L23